nr:RHS repeat-associated core domain-containing protein [Brevibacillus borstelensis]
MLDPEKNEYRYGYDPYGNLVQVTENNTQTTKYHYNALSWKISETDVPSGAAETFGYTPNGKVSVFTDKAGNRHEYAYTPFYELSELTTKDKAGTVKNRETKEYYPNTSLVKKETNSNGPNIQSSSPLYRELFYTYDPFLRMNSFTAFGRLYQIRHTDADDQMDQLIYPGNTTVSYVYDDAMRVKEVTIPGSNGSSQTVRYDYQLSDAGDTYTLTYPNGVSLVRKRDSFGQVDTLKHFKSGTSVWQEKNSYSFGNVTSIERNGTTYRYEYDKVDRLTKENVPAGENRYSYNGRGSRMTFEGTLPAMPSTATYTFDERNRLRGVTNEKTGAKAEYTYYPDGLRATKTADGSETRYVYLNGRVIEELDKNGQLKAQNIWGNELLSRKDVAANKRGYYLYNSHGDVVKVVGENGEELNRYEYDTWGNLTAKTEGMSNPFTYSGEILDGETGFYYLRARYYDPTVGRFISEDTYKGQVDNPLSLNRYTYVENNPLRYKDPTGHWKDGDEYIQGSTRDTIALWTDVWEKANKAGNKQRMQFAESQADNARTAYWSNLGASIAKDLELRPTAVLFAGTTATMPRSGSGSVSGGAIGWAAVAATILTIATQDTSTSTTTYNYNGQTLIFRDGSGTNTNLTPRLVDTTGLSYFLAPVTNKYTFTSIDAVNATGVLKAVIDNPATGHVSVFATNPAHHKAWIASRPDAESNPYYLTIVLKSISIKGR